MGAEGLEATIAEAKRTSEQTSEEAERMKASHDEQLVEAAQQLELVRDEKESLIKELKANKSGPKMSPKLTSIMTSVSSFVRRASPNLGPTKSPVSEPAPSLQLPNMKLN